MITKDILIRDLRYFETEEAKLMHEARQASGRSTHLRAGSTLIAAMGQHWAVGSWEAVKAMADYSWKQGLEVCLYEEHDRCYNRYDALGTMRNLAYMRAMREGWEYLLYVDNDVLPPLDALEKLLQNPVPVQSPIVTYLDGTDHGLSMPNMERGRGLVMVTSCVLSFLLCETKTFFPWWQGGFWRDAVGADETYHFAKFQAQGVRPFVDTNVVVPCVNGPSYPLDHKPEA